MSNDINNKNPYPLAFVYSTIIKTHVTIHLSPQIRVNAAITDNNKMK